MTNQTGLAYRAAAKALDPDRPTAANGNTDGLDVQGFSHAGSGTFVHFHAETPNVPTVLSECCSCTSQRLDRADTSTCMSEQNSPGLLPYVTGSLGVWTLSVKGGGGEKTKKKKIERKTRALTFFPLPFFSEQDYYGEPGTWPSVSSSFGNFDLAGFPKPHAYWYVTNWLALADTSDYARPPLPPITVTRILDLIDQVDSQIAGITSAPQGTRKGGVARRKALIRRKASK